MDTKNRKTPEQGYTIIEAVVVIAIILAFLGITVPNYSQMRLQAALTRTVYKFQQDARRAQSMSLSGGLVGGFGVYIDLNLSQLNHYVLYKDVAPVNQAYDPNVDSIVEDITLESGIIVGEVDNVVGNSVSINFNSPNATVGVTPFASQDTICVVFTAESDPSLQRKVSVNNAGLVQVLSANQACQ